MPTTTSCCAKSLSSDQSMKRFAASTNSNMAIAIIVVATAIRCALFTLSFCRRRLKRQPRPRERAEAVPRLPDKQASAPRQNRPKPTAARYLRHLIPVDPQRTRLQAQPYTPDTARTHPQRHEPDTVETRQRHDRDTINTHEPAQAGTPDSSQGKTRRHERNRPPGSSPKGSRDPNPET